VSADGAAAVTVIGEALIDFVPGDQPRSFVALPGGSPFNVGVTLARLGLRTALMARLADNPFGRILRERAMAEGLDLSAAPAAREPTTLAVVSLDEQARASYDFYLQGTADWQWTADETARLPADTQVLHFGSLAAWTPPGDEPVLSLASRLRRRGEALVSYDPNVRPALLDGRDQGRRRVERGVALAHLAKASAEDIDWMYPGMPGAEVARRWLGLGVTTVIITDGADGATAFTAGAPPVHRPGRPVTVADTVGAGDAFTGGLIAALAERDLHRPARLAGCPAATLGAVLDDAISVAAITCERPGADPPRRAELGPDWGRA
jgi:fructokinase